MTGCVPTFWESTGTFGPNGSSVMVGSQRRPLCPPVALVIGAGFGPFGLNPCLPDRTPGVWGILEPSTHWFGTYKDSRVRRVPWEGGKSCPRWWTFTVALADLSHPQPHHHPNLPSPVPQSLPRPFE